MTTTTTTTTRTTTPFSSFVPTEDSAIVSMGLRNKQRGEARGVSYTQQQGGIQIQHTTTTTDPPASGFAAPGDVVSPLRIDQQHDSSSSHTDNEEEEEEAHPPPVGEIRIPTLTTTTSETQYRYRHQPINYEQLYYLSVRRNYRMKQKFCCVAEENRRLKRHLIELQKRLFSSSRNNKRSAPAEAWTVPTTNKRRNCSSSSVPQSVVSTEEHPDVEEAPSP